jgi:hypothetical protein
LWPHRGPAVAPWPALVFLSACSGAAPDTSGPAPWDTRRTPHARHRPTPARRRRLLLDVTPAASEVSRLVHEARDVNLPVEPGVREGRDALVRWAVLLEELLP